MKHLNSKKIALTAVFAALYYVMSYLPGVPAIGVPGVKIQLEACMASVFGLILGPYLGALATFVGVLTAWALPPGNMSITGLIFAPSPVINALSVGLIYEGKWKSAFIILALLIAGFWFLPPTQPIEQNFMVGIAATWDKILALLLIAPTFLLMRRIFGGYRSEAAVEKRRKYEWAIILSLISAILIMVNAYMIATTENVIKLQYEFQGNVYKITFGKGLRNLVEDIYGMSFRDSIKFPYGYLLLLLGVGVLIGAIILYIKPEHNVLGGSLILAFSGISAIIGGGFILGLILGVLGGLLGVTRAEIGFLRLKILNMELLVYFMLSFIGNEADNAWGNFIFAAPIVFEGIFQMPLEFVRWAFLVSPYAYFIIRLIQAAIASLVALPLINNLRAAGFGILPSFPKKSD